MIAITHHAGCSIRLGGEEHRLLQRTLAGIARHPNVGGYLFVGLGCEVNQIDEVIASQHLGEGTALIVQDQGGVRKTVEAGIAAVEAMLPLVNATGRTPQPLSDLMVALQCGGSDSWSGVTANPLVGLLADEVVRQGGTVVLGETPEIYGAEQLLLRRAVSEEVGQKLIERVRWWEAYAEKHGIEIDNNPTPGNKAGGLTTIYEKSLGAIAKGGSTPLTGVYQYAEPVTARGFTFMDTPGNDWVGVTGQVAGGCTLVVFTTGRGSAFGFKPAPSIKVASNSVLYRRMQDDMDVNAGRVLGGRDNRGRGRRVPRTGHRRGLGTALQERGAGHRRGRVLPLALGRTLVGDSMGTIWDLYGALTRRLLWWSIGSILAGLALLLWGDAFWRGFGIQAAAWGAVDAAIALLGWQASRRRQRAYFDPRAAEVVEREAIKLRRLLLFNTALDVLYVAGGLILVLTLGKRDAAWRGHGWGIVAQGGFLFLFDLVHAQLVPFGVLSRTP